MDYKFIDGGVTAPSGFKAAGVHCGIRKSQSKLDLAMIYSKVSCTAAAVYTKNLVQGAHIAVTKENLKNGTARAVICNSGNANTCNADGEEKAHMMCKSAAKELGIDEKDVIVASTGVIGQILPIGPIENAVPELVKSLSVNGSENAAKAIMTTDTVVKNLAAECSACGKTIKIGGIAKGSGMIHPNMGTLLCFLTTDASISSKALDSALRSAVDVSFNMVSIDGDTSTNDTCTAMASGLAGNTEILSENSDGYKEFTETLTAVCTALARMIAKDGEGASKLIVCSVSGAKDKQNARKVAKAVIHSDLLKAAMFGSDANWGRVLCAVGYSGAKTDINKIGVSFSSKAGKIEVCKNGAGIPFDEAKAKKILSEDEVSIFITMCDGNASATAYGCDLTYDYVKINGEYRS